MESNQPPYLTEVNLFIRDLTGHVNECKADVLGSEYTLRFIPEDKDPQLDNSNAYCDSCGSTIVIDDLSKLKDLCPDAFISKDMVNRLKVTIRHELIHAFMHESGITTCSHLPWAHDETLVEWLAVQLPKMAKTMQDLKVL